MVAEVLVRRWCDRHNAAGDKIEGESYVLCLDGKTTREIDLCGECAAEFLLDLREVVERHGRRALDAEGNPIVVGGGRGPGRPPARKATPLSTSTASSAVLVSPDATPPPHVQAALDADETPVGLGVAIICPVCEARSGGWNSWTQHLRRVHGPVTSDLFGDTCPLDGRRGDRTGLGNHTTGTHGLTALQAFEAAIRLDAFPEVVGPYLARVELLRAGKGIAA